MRGSMVARRASGQLKRDVAVKLPATSDDPTALATLRQRFARERDFLAQLEHPNIARLYDAGVSDSGQPFLAMEFVAGRGIAEHCDAQRLTVKSRLELFLQVLDAVAYAHQRLVLHRDLKAANVLVDAQGQVRLLDFGVARLLPEIDGAASSRSGGPTELTELTERAGAAYTLGHAAPEQLTHGRLSTATDVYALGVMLHHLLTGLSPYRPARDSRGALEDAVLLVTPEPASSRLFAAEALAARDTDVAGLRKALRGDLDTILAKALKKDPAERYPTATALAQDLRRHLARLPISARPDGWAYRARLFIARHRLGVAATALATLALLGSSGVAIWQARASAAHAAQAEKEAARAGAAQKFFAGLLANADPEKNKDITALDRRVVDEALASAERDFADAPETLALVLRQLGDIYARQGMLPRLLEVQKKRVALLATLPATPTDELVQAQLDFGSALGDSSLAEERAQAAPVLLQAHALALSRHAGNARVVEALYLIAQQYLAESKYRQADNFAEQAVAWAERTLTSPDPELSRAYVQRAATAIRLGDLDTARAMHRKAAAVDATGRGLGKLEQLNGRVQLANAEYLAGNYREARREALAALDFARAELGDTGINLTALRFRAAMAAVQAGDLDDATQAVEQLAATTRQSADPFQGGMTHLAQGVVAMARGQLDMAAQDFALAAPGLAPDPRWRRSGAAWQGTLLLKQGRAGAAYELLAPVLAEIRAEGDSANEELPKVAEPVAVILARRGQIDAARSLLAEACQWRRASLTPQHPNRVRCEAYAILMDAQRSPTERALALQRQAHGLTEGRDDRLALATSLQFAQTWAGRHDLKAGQAQDFPLLD